MSTIQVFLNGGKYHWLSHAGQRKKHDAVFTKHHEAWIAKVRAERQPVSESTRSKADAIDEGVREAAAFSRHRNKHRVSHAHIAAQHEGLAESVAFARHRNRHRVAFGIIPAEVAPTHKPSARHIPSEDRIENTPAPAEPELPVTHQLAAWSKAVQILDGSEVLVRDVIERELAGVDFIQSNSAFNRVMDRIMARITEIRTEAIRTAFIIVRDRLGDHPIADVSLARWAATFLSMDLKNIDMTIRAAVVAGDDPDEIARKIVGSMAQNGVDGVTEFTRLRVAHLGRAAIKASNLRKRGIEIA